ncbi:MAG: hypothetical protein ABSG41_26785 [Bryobacteraceae bacterium]|jgi:hypothetical protein
MADYKELEDALGLVGELCTSEQIQSLLRTRKGTDQVRITAESKDDLIGRNLRTAIEARAIPLDAVFNLIREAEENGNQHIFYFRSRTKKLNDAMNREFFGQQLWGANWERHTASFPAIRLKPNDFKYSDLHRPNPRKPRDWLLKIYGDSLITRATGKAERRGDNVVWREFVEEPLRIVLIARWNSPDLLEIRVQRDESRRRIDAWVSQVWQMLKPALVREQFEEWDLSDAMKQLILAQEKNRKVYEFRDASLVDGEGGGVHANFNTFSDAGNLFASVSAKRSIQDFMSADSSCNGLTVTWLPDANRTPPKELRTILKAKRANEIVAIGHCTAQDLDHVTEQLRSIRKSS